MDARQASFVLIIASVAGVPAAAAQVPVFEEIPLPAGSMPAGIATGPDSTMWISRKGARALMPPPET